MRWNVVHGGEVVGELEAGTWHEAVDLARAAHGIGARPSAPADTTPRPRRKPRPSWVPPRER